LPRLVTGRACRRRAGASAVNTGPTEARVGERPRPGFEARRPSGLESGGHGSLDVVSSHISGEELVAGLLAVASGAGGERARPAGSGERKEKISQAAGRLGVERVEPEHVAEERRGGLRRPAGPIRGPECTTVITAKALSRPEGQDSTNAPVAGAARPASKSSRDSRRAALAPSNNSRRRYREADPLEIIVRSPQGSGPWTVRGSRP